MSKQIEEVMALVDKQTGQFLAMLKLFNEGKVEGGEDAASKARETRASIEAKLRELLPVWQPIESVPTKEEILLLSDEGIYQGKWSDKDSFEPLTLDWHGCGCCGEGRPKPTHWMPLPKAPE